MAERITKVRECDNQTTDLQEWRGELCPLHQNLARIQAETLFRNTKEYDDGTTDDLTTD